MTMVVSEFSGVPSYAVHVSLILALIMGCLGVVRYASVVVTHPTTHAALKMVIAALLWLARALGRQMTSRYHDPATPKSRVRRGVERGVTVAVALFLLGGAGVIIVQAVVFLLLVMPNVQGSIGMTLLTITIFFSFLCGAKIVGVQGLDELRTLRRASQVA